MAYEDIAPSFAVEINGFGIDDAVSALITSLEYDSLDGASDMMKLNLSNPDLILCDKKLFALGNEIRLWAGFGSELRFVGGCVIEKSRPTFPAAGTMPTIEVVGYSASQHMAKNSPAPVEDNIPFASKDSVGQTELAKQKKKKKNARKANGSRGAGRVWKEGMSYSDVIRDKAEQYGFDADVDETPYTISAAGVFQKTDIDDFKFISMIANEFKWLFWVDANEGDGWTLHFKDPNRASEIQDREYDFSYNTRDASLLSFEGEQLLGNGPTEVQAQIWDPFKKELKTYSVKVDPAEETESPEYFGEIDEPLYLRPPTQSELASQTAAQKGGIAQGSEITLAFGGVAVTTVTDRAFASPAELKVWVEAWAQEQGQDFYTGRGVMRGPGVETLRARQVHTLSGLPAPWSGKYYFTNVVHRWNAATGYEVEFSGRKITRISRGESPDV